MHTHKVYIGILLAALLAVSGCGDSSGKKGIVLSGTLAFPESVADSDAPVLVSVTSSIDADLLENNPREVIIAYVVADKANASFRVDLSGKGLKAGDIVYLIAFVDNNYTNDVPFPDKGDLIGVYYEEGKITPGVELHEGLNEGFHIDINREVFDYEASVSGRILGDDTGEVTLVAYAGDIESSDFTSLDFNDVMGFKTLTKGSGSQAYTIDILPYGRDVPIENLQVFALLDANGSGSVDGGDRIGFYAKTEEEFSSLITITGGEVSGIDMEFKFDVKSPSASPVSVSGDFSLPAAYSPGAPPVYIAVFDGSDPDAVMADPFGAILYFSRITAPETNFFFDLTDTGLAPGDRVMLIGLWDKDFVGGFPGFTPGDVIGTYFEAGKITPAVELHEGLNEGFHIDINREVFDYEASVSGRILGDDTGEVTLVAYAGDIESSDFTSLDFNDVMGFKTLTKGSGSQAYTIDILPYGRDVPIENLQVFALLDANGSGSVDGGDRIGFYAKTEEEFSSLITITGGEVSGIDMEFKLDVQQASGIDMSIAGMFTVSSEYFYGDSPMYIIVYSADDPQDIFEDPYAGLKYFYRMPLADFYFDCDLSHTDLVPGESVIIAGLWDRDFTGGFPGLTSGDKIGIVQNKDTYQFAAELNYGRNMTPPAGYEFRINKLIYDFDADIDYALDMSGTGSFDVEKAKIMVLAIHVEGVSGSLNAACEIELGIDMDYLLGVDILPATAYDYIGIGEKEDPCPPRRLPILTALYEEVVVWEDNQPPDPLIKGLDHGTKDERTAYLVAILDKNGNGQLDREDEIGYYGTDVVEIIDGIPTGDLPCCFDLDIPEWFSGKLYLPTPIKRITKGTNREQRNDGSYGPYWISGFRSY